MWLLVVIITGSYIQDVKLVHTFSDRNACEYAVQQIIAKKESHIIPMCLPAKESQIEPGKRFQK